MGKKKKQMYFLLLSIEVLVTLITNKTVPFSTRREMTRSTTRAVCLLDSVSVLCSFLKNVKATLKTETFNYQVGGLATCRQICPVTLNPSILPVHS